MFDIASACNALIIGIAVSFALVCVAVLIICRRESVIFGDMKRDGRCGLVSPAKIRYLFPSESEEGESDARSESDI